MKGRFTWKIDPVFSEKGNSLNKGKMACGSVEVYESITCHYSVRWKVVGHLVIWQHPNHTGSSMSTLLRKELGTTQMCDHINVQQKRTEAVQRHR